jgi:uncharacterized protein (TIGR02300 family)
MNFKETKPVATASADKKGMKRICPSCSTRFYDFNKRPINCPNCKTEFTGEIKARARRSRPANDVIEEGQVSEATAAKKGAVADEEDDDILVDAEEGVVSLEDLDEDKEVIEDDEEGAADLELDEDALEDDDLDDDDDDDDDEEEDDDDDDGEEDAKPKRKKK